MYKRIALIAAITACAVILYHLSQNKAIPAIEEDITEIYIINGDHEDSAWFAGPSKSELLRAFSDYPDHLFVTQSVWAAFCKHRSQQLENLRKNGITSLQDMEVVEGVLYNKKDKTQTFSQDEDSFFYLATLVAFKDSAWDFYDTGIGLYYLKPYDIEPIMPVNNFTKIEHPCDIAVEPSVVRWAEKFIKLFDLPAWHKLHKNGKRSVVCISGHGTASTCKVARACGMPAEDFAKLVQFFNNDLHITTLGIQSCFWPAQRITSFMKEAGTNLTCTLITPIDQEKELHFAAAMPIVWSYNSDNNKIVLAEGLQGDTLLAGLHELTTSFDGVMTEELSEKLQTIHVVDINHTKNMKTAIMQADTTEPILV